MAPETLVESDQKFTEKSDVWSFGVTMWEIYDGETRKPYDNYEENEVREIILKEKTLEISNKKCHRILKVLLEQCWKKPIERPTFQEIILTLENYKIEKVFKARLVQGNLLKKVIVSLKDLLNEVTWYCADTGIQLQGAMNNSQVSFVSVLLRPDGFDEFRCDHQLSMGVNFTSMSKIFRCAAVNDIITIKTQDQAETVTFMFESPNQEVIADYEMKKLMNLDQKHLGIPETDYAAVIKMPSAEFQRIIKDLSQFGESIVISCTNEGVKFSVAGDIVVANINLAPTANVDKVEETVSIEMQKPVKLTFACQYLNMFTKASCLAPQVSLSMSPEVFLVLEYKIGDIGHIRYYLAPRIEELKIFEARLVQGNLLKNVLESLKDLRNEAIWDCSDTGIQIQTKDKSNLYRASMILRADGFNKFRCDFQHRMRIKLSEMSEILKCAATNDIITIKAQEQAEMVTFMFESTNQEKMADYEMKLMNLDEEHLSIPETDYAAVIKMPSAELQRVINALSQFSESVVISCTKEDVQFSVAGDISVVNIKVAQTANVNKEEKAVSIEIQRPVSMTLACQYLNMFTKASYLASQVSLSMSPEVCLVVEYKIGDIGHICYYLTPKI